MEFYVLPAAGSLSADYTVILDNAPSHACRVAKAFYDGLGKTTTGGPRIVMQPPHSPDLSPLDFFVFNEVKRELPVVRTIAELRVQAVLAWNRTRAKAGVAKLGQEFRRRLQACIDARGGHFEL